MTVNVLGPFGLLPGGHRQRAARPKPDAVLWTTDTAEPRRVMAIARLKSLPRAEAGYPFMADLRRAQTPDQG
jgi:hypothetical protein